MEIDEHISFLISGYMNRTAADEELSELYSWLEEAEEHRRYFSDLVITGSAARTLNDPAFEDRRKRMLSRLNNRIDAQSAPVRGRRHRKIQAWAGAAAAVALVAGFMFVHDRLDREPVRQSPQLLSYINTSSEVSPVRLEDGTEVLLGPESRLDYHVGVYQGRTERRADICGKAYFDVKRDTARPFIVNSGELLVRVLGTRFIVESHPDSSATKIMLEEGSIRLQTPERVNLVRLAENQQAVYLKEEEDLDVEAAEVGSYVLENFKRISFRHITIDEMITEIGKIYGTVLYCDRDTDDTTYEMNFYRTNTLGEVLDIIEALTGVRLLERTE